MLPFDVVELATDLIDSLGYVGVFLLIFLENVFPPIPSEVVLLLAGFNVDQGRMGFFPALLASTLGSAVGALVLYALGWVLGDERVKRFLAWFGRFVLISRRDIDRADAWFERYGAPVVFFARLVPLVRSLVSIPAGANRRPGPVPFVVLTAAGSAIWNALWLLLGWILGAQYEKAGRWADYAQYAVVLAIVGALGWFVLGKRRSRRSLTAREERG